MEYIMQIGKAAEGNEDSFSNLGVESIKSHINGIESLIDEEEKEAHGH
jgi:hypothetical protein